jgi:hypothetical protein
VERLISRETLKELELRGSDRRDSLKHQGVGLDDANAGVCLGRDAVGRWLDHGAAKIGDADGDPGSLQSTAVIHATGGAGERPLGLGRPAPCRLGHSGEPRLRG